MQSLKKDATHALKFPLTINEEVRVRRLEQLCILDTPADPAFDAIVVRAKEMLCMPMALISLVDRERQWFKARFGVDVTETPRELAFCGHAILDNGVMVVPDTHEDARFIDNGLVTSAPNLRFYAGAPIIIEGAIALGTVCVMDTKPHHTFGDDKSATLAGLADEVAALITARL